MANRLSAGVGFTVVVVVEEGCRNWEEEIGKRFVIKKKVIWKKLGLDDFLYYKSRGNFFFFVEKKYSFILTCFLPKNFIH